MTWKNLFRISDNTFCNLNCNVQLLARNSLVIQDKRGSLWQTFSLVCKCGRLRDEQKGNFLLQTAKYINLLRGDLIAQLLTVIHSTLQSPNIKQSDLGI